MSHPFAATLLSLSFAAPLQAQMRDRAADRATAEGIDACSADVLARRDTFALSPCPVSVTTLAARPAPRYTGQNPGGE
jgi:hypothetical protein